MGLYKTISIGASALTVDGASVGATYDIPLGDPSLYINDEIAFFVVEGNSTTLATSLSITSTYTPATPMSYKFVFDGGVVIGGNNLSFFGTQLTATQALYPCVIECWYDGTAWNVVPLRVEVRATGLTNSQFAQMAGKTIKMNSGEGAGTPQDVTYESFKGQLNLDYDVVTTLMSFRSGDTASRQDMIVPYNGTVETIGYSVVNTLGSNDDAQIVVSFGTSFGGGKTPINGTPFTIPAGSTLGTVGTVTPAYNNVLSNSPENYLIFEGTNDVWGGEVLISVVIAK